MLLGSPQTQRYQFLTICVPLNKFIFQKHLLMLLLAYNCHLEGGTKAILFSVIYLVFHHVWLFYILWTRRGVFV